MRPENLARTNICRDERSLAGKREDEIAFNRWWKKPRFGKSNLIAADGKLLFSTLDGELVLVRSSPTGFEEIGRQTVLGPTRQAPSLADGFVYLRDDKKIICLDLKR